MALLRNSVILSLLLLHCWGKNMADFDYDLFSDKNNTETKPDDMDDDYNLIDRMDTTNIFDKLKPIKFPIFENRNCKDLYTSGFRKSGVYKIYPYKCCEHKYLKVYCDMETDAGGWTVIQRRDDVPVHENFNRTWIQYALGFGNVESEFWLGLDNIHALTDSYLNELRIDLEDFDGESGYAKYSFFYVHNRENEFMLEVEDYNGTVGDSFARISNGMKFSTKDKDLDKWNQSCAERFNGAWWYKSCHQANLNAIYHRGNHSSYADGVNWKTWRGYNYSLKKSEMKIRPRF